MFQCDNCLEWFHGECLGVKVNVIKSANHYICHACTKRFNFTPKDE